MAGKTKSKSIETMSKAELEATAKQWVIERKKRALREFSQWRLMPDGTLVNKAIDDKVYVCGNVQRIEVLDVNIFTGCDCGDEKDHLYRMRDALKRFGLDIPVACKHAYIRLLLGGHTLHIEGVGNVTVKTDALK